MSICEKLLEELKIRDFRIYLNKFEELKDQIPKNISNKINNELKIIKNILNKNSKNIGKLIQTEKIIHHLNNIYSLIENNKEKINAFSKRVTHFHINCDGITKIELPQIHLPGDRIIILDSNFIKSVEERANKDNKTEYDLVFPQGEILFFKKVDLELSRGRFFNPNSPLVSSKTRNFFISLCSGKIVNPIDLKNPFTNSCKNLILKVWEDECSKSNFSSLKEFSQTAELEILIYCLSSNPNLKILIYSDDKDISETLTGFKNIFLNNLGTIKPNRLTYYKSWMKPGMNFLMGNVKIIKFRKGILIKDRNNLFEIAA